MAHLEDNNVLHAQVLLDEVHALGAVYVLESVVVITVQPIHDVPFEMFQEIDFALEVVRVFRYSMVLPNINGTLTARRDVIKVAIFRVSQYTCNNVTKIYSLLVRRQDDCRAVIKMHADRTISQRVSHSIFVAVIDPGHNEHLGIW